MIGQHSVADFECYRLEYGVPVTQQLTRSGAELIAGDLNPMLLEGTWGGNLVLLSAFDPALAR